MAEFIIGLKLSSFVLHIIIVLNSSSYFTMQHFFRFIVMLHKAVKHFAYECCIINIPIWIQSLSLDDWNAPNHDLSLRWSFLSQLRLIIGTNKCFHYKLLMQCIIVREPRDQNKANFNKVRQIAKFGMIVYYKIVINNLI